MDVRESYDSAAEAYTDHLATELERKPLDRHLLDRFAEGTRGQGLVAEIGCGPGHVGSYLHAQGVTVAQVPMRGQTPAVPAGHRHGVVERDARAGVQALPALVLQGVQEGHGLHEMRGEPLEEQSALLQRLADEGDRKSVV